MQLLVTHLTRMGHPRICVAGIDLATAANIRPVRTADDPLTLDDTRERGGVFALGGIVDLGETAPCGSPPETEDHRFQRRTARFENVASDDELWSTLSEAARNTLLDLFGPDLRETGRTYAVDLGKGRASLGCLRATQPLNLYVGSRAGKPTLRLALRLDGRDRDLAVTDLRLFTNDFSAPNREAITQLNDRMQHAAQILLAVGLTRPLQTSGHPARHWLQVNTIFYR